MTTDEQSTIATLCLRIEEMRDAVTAMEATLSERCPAHLARLNVLETELYGRAGNSRNRGIVGRVQDLEVVAGEMRGLKLWVLRTTGAIITTLAVTTIAWLLVR